MAKQTTKKTAPKPEKTEKEKLAEIGKCAYESIAEMVAKLSAEDAEGNEDDTAREQAREEIQQDALSVEVNYGWVSPGELPHDGKSAPEKFRILLGTGGPAIRIVGKLNRYGEPESATLQSQDWGTLWTNYTEADESVLLAYCQCFWFGE